LALIGGRVHAQSGSTTTLAIERIAGGSTGGVMEVRVDGRPWGALFEEDRLAREVGPGSYRLEVRLLRSEGGREIFGVEPLELSLEVRPGRAQEVSLTLVPEALGPVLKASLSP
jgi:hypothetical protein